MTKRTFGGTKRKASRVSGFKTRMKTKNGQKLIHRRRSKKRKAL